MRRTLALTLLLATAACGVAGVGGFDRYDGRWVADVAPRVGCGSLRVAIDVDGHQLSGSAESDQGVLQIKGRVDDHGTAAITEDGKPGRLRFAGENFTTRLPGDACGREVTGNRGG